MKNKLSNIIGKTKKTLEKPELLFLPASITYYIMLAIVPMFTILVLVASQFSLSISSVVDFLRDILPEQAASVIIDVISGRGFDTNVGIFTFFAFLVSADGMYAIIVASNTLYKVENNNIIKDRVKSFILLFVIITYRLLLQHQEVLFPPRIREKLRHQWKYETFCLRNQAGLLLQRCLHHR